MDIKTIVEKLKKAYSILVNGNFLEYMAIRQVMFLSENISDSTPYTLYLAHWPCEIQDDFDGIILLVDCADKPDLANCLYIKESIDIFELFNSIQSIIYRQTEIDYKKEELFGVLQAAGGITSLTRVAYSFLGNPITICDTSFSVVTRVPEGVGTDDLEKDGERVYIKDASVASMQTEKLIDKIFHDKEPFFYKREQYEYIWLYCSIRIQQAVIGYICIQGINREFTDEDVDFTKIFASMLSVEMQKSDFFVHKAGFKYEYFLADLLDGNFNDELVARNRAKALGKKSEANFWVLVFSYDFNQQKRLTSRYYVEQMLSIFPTDMASFYIGTPIMLLSKKENKPFNELQMKKLEFFLKYNQMYCAVSFSFSRLVEARNYYNQAVFCSALTLHTNNRITFYEQCMLIHILKSAEKDTAMSTFVHPDISRLIKYDKEHNTEFVNTLRCYLKQQRNAAKTSQAMNIHKSTFFYRMKKICEIAEFSLEDTDKLILFDISFQILDLL